jgi:hypothetical protein
LARTGFLLNCTYTSALITPGAAQQLFAGRKCGHPDSFYRSD